MKKASFALVLSSLLRHGLAQEKTDTPANETIVVTTEGTSTWSQTFIPTSLSQYSTLTAATTVTTTDAGGAAVVVALLAGGLAWWAIPSPAGAPTVNFPTATPTPPKVSNAPTPSSEGPKISTSSQFTNPASPTQAAAVLTLGSGWHDYVGQKPIKVDDDVQACGFPSDDDGTVARGPASDKIDAFCKDKDGAKVVVGEPLVEEYSVDNGVKLNITVQQNEVCAFDKEQTLDGGDCNFYLHQALDNCNLDTTDNKKGGTVSDECFKYMLHPEDSDGDLTCTDSRDGTGINRDAALKSIADFCKKYNGIASTPGQGNLLSYQQDLGDSQATISVSYGEVAGCPRGGGKGSSYTIDERSCVRFLSRTIDDCDTSFQAPYGKYGGSVADGCGVFKFEAHVVEKVGCPANDQYTPPVNIKSADADRAIDHYCNADLTLDPNYQSDNQFHQFQPPGQSYDNFADGLDNYVIRMSANFLADQSGCQDKQKFNTKGDECKRKLKKIIQTCPDKPGGALTDKTNNGCVAWMIYGQGTSN